jgi:hypothetical protein
LYRSHLERDHQLLSGYRQDVLAEAGRCMEGEQAIALDADVLRDKNLSVFL